jgi:hypothetical protein
MTKQKPPVSLRPSRKAQPIVDKLLKERRLNRTLNDFLESLGSDSVPILQMEIEEAQERIAQRAEENAKDLKLINFNQGKINSLVHKDDAVINAQKEVLSHFHEITSKDRLRGEAYFRSWLTGPANIELMQRAGFNNDDQAVKWCKAQKVVG